MHTYSQSYKPERLPSVLHIIIVLMAFLAGAVVLVLAGIAGDVG
jgi:hypothetical protein